MSDTGLTVPGMPNHPSLRRDHHCGQGRWHLPNPAEFAAAAEQAASAKAASVSAHTAS